MIFDSWTKALIYFGIMNLLGLIVMGADKWKAKHNAWRIPEKTLFLVSILGGSVGTWAGMYLFRHKTKHWYFVVGMPLILAIQIVIALVVWRTWICLIIILQSYPYSGQSCGVYCGTGWSNNLCHLQQNWLLLSYRWR